METGTQNSFIPHDVAESTRDRVKAGSLTDIVLLLSIVLLVASAALAGGVFLYKQYLETSSKSKINQLRIAKAQFDPALFQEFSRLDDRMREAETLLGNHIAPSIFFKILEANTLTTVAFRYLELHTFGEGGVAIKMDGIANSVNSIALQADFFSKVGIITSPIFSNIDRRLDGVHFSFTANINQSAIRYAQLAAGYGGNTAPTTQAPVEVPSSGFFPAQPVNQQQ